MLTVVLLPLTASFRSGSTRNKSDFMRLFAFWRYMWTTIHSIQGDNRLLQYSFDQRFQYFLSLLATGKKILSQLILQLI
jgi:hypothetical protein